MSVERCGFCANVHETEMGERVTFGGRVMKVCPDVPTSMGLVIINTAHFPRRPSRDHPLRQSSLRVNTVDSGSGSNPDSPAKLSFTDVSFIDLGKLC